MHDISIEQKAEALFRGTVALCELAKSEIIPILTGIVQKTDHEQAMIGTYYRMQLWMISLAKLDHPIHFQTVLNGTRGLLELLVDLKLLLSDASLAEKYHDYSFVTRFSAAKKFSTLAKT